MDDLAEAFGLGLGLGAPIRRRQRVIATIQLGSEHDDQTTRPPPSVGLSLARRAAHDRIIPSAPKQRSMFLVLFARVLPRCCSHSGEPCPNFTHMLVGTTQRDLSDAKLMAIIERGRATPALSPPTGEQHPGWASQQLQRLQGINSDHQASPTTKPTTTNATRKTSVSVIRLCRPAVGSGSVGVSTMSPYTGCAAPATARPEKRTSGIR